ncbi:hypothetical protein TrVE_jg4060 [Triparma verrucosa]|uniref:Uncharacterized protein n=1 Tax=Triparma verrucosa TaxID=1606542 RepID=A0A9W7BJ15_9STRA|nr:hypothetical protein TrVE_jg4060 [Triparma verrucosa]
MDADTRYRPPFSGVNSHNKDTPAPTAAPITDPSMPPITAKIKPGNNRESAEAETEAKVATPSPHASRLWHTLLPLCDIVYHVHIPKTAGTSIAHVLMNTTGWAKVGAEGRPPHAPWQAYVSHGQQHWWKTTDLLQRARQTRSQIIVTAETGIDDLVAGGYPWFENTCFFSVVREPHEWLMSAENHMRVTGYQVSQGFNGTYGYFDRRNIQSKMVGLEEKRAGVVMCIATVGGVNSLLAAFSDMPLPHDNVRPHALVTTPEVAEVVLQKYALDVELWDVVSRRDVLCW